MRLQNKIGLSILPLVTVSIAILGVWSINTAKKGIEESSRRSIEMALSSFMNEEIIFHYDILKKNGLEKVDFYVTEYQQRIIKAVSDHTNNSKNKYAKIHLFALNELGEMVFCNIHKAISSHSWQELSHKVAFDPFQKQSGALMTRQGLEHYTSQYFKPWGWVIFAAIPDHEIQVAAVEIRNATISIALLCILGSFLLIILVFQKLLVGPISRLQKGMQIIGSGNLDHKVVTDTNDEIGQLSRSFDAMTHDLKFITASRDEFEQEIVARKKAQAELQKSQTMLAEAQRITNLGSWELDLIENRLTWSDEIYRIFGLIPQELEATYKAFLARVHPDDRKQVDSAYQKSLEEKSPYALTHRIVRPDSTIRTVHEQCEHFQDNSGTIIRSIGSVLDITERIKSDEELKKYREHLEDLVRERTFELEVANGRLRELDRLKTMFIATMSHELRTPLNAIIGFNTVVLDGMTGAINDTQRDYLERVAKSSSHLLAMVTDILDISKIEAGQIKVTPQQVILRDLVAEAVNCIRGNLNKKELGLTTNVPRDLVVYTDSKRLLQCLANLLSNAVKFTERGAIQITAQKNDDGVQISVKDSGIGIGQNDLETIFKPFERLQTHMMVTAGVAGLFQFLW